MRRASRQYKAVLAIRNFSSGVNNQTQAVACKLEKYPRGKLWKKQDDSQLLVGFFFFCIRKFLFCCSRDRCHIDHIAFPIALFSCLSCFSWTMPLSFTFFILI